MSFSYITLHHSVCNVIQPALSPDYDRLVGGGVGRVKRGRSNGGLRASVRPSVGVRRRCLYNRTPGDGQWSQARTVQIGGGRWIWGEKGRQAGHGRATHTPAKPQLITTGRRHCEHEPSRPPRHPPAVHPLYTYRAGDGRNIIQKWRAKQHHWKMQSCISSCANHATSVRPSVTFPGLYSQRPLPVYINLGGAYAIHRRRDLYIDSGAWTAWEPSTGRARTRSATDRTHA